MKPPAYTLYAVPSFSTIFTLLTHDATRPTTRQEAQESVALGDTDMCVQLIHGLAVVYLTRACFLDNHISAAQEVHTLILLSNPTQPNQHNTTSLSANLNCNNS